MLTGPDLLTRLCRDDFLVFLDRAIRIISSDKRLEPEWYLEALRLELAQLENGTIRRLIVNLPPRTLKSTIISVAWIAWRMGHDPHLRVICASYSDDLASFFSDMFRRLVRHQHFQQIFPDFEIEKDTDGEVRTRSGGYRLSTSIGGTLTGRGADLIVVDDPMNAIAAKSANERERVNHWFDTALLPRLDNPRKDSIVVVMQRLHIDDLSGHLLEGGGWRHFSLGARNGDTPRHFTLLRGRSHIWPPHALLTMRQFDEGLLEDYRRSMGEAAFSAQYLQQPVPADGAIFREAWFRSYDALPSFEKIVSTVISVDTAIKTSLMSDFTVCTVWLMTRDNNYYLVDLHREKLGFPSLVQLVQRLIARHRPQHLLIEDAGNGSGLCEQLGRITGCVTHAIKPRYDKETRANLASNAFEEGRVHFNRSALWWPHLRDELLAFPSARHDDQVDSITQFIQFAEDRLRVVIPNVTPYEVLKEERSVFDW